MEDMKKDSLKKGIPLSFEINEDKKNWIYILFIIDGSLILIGLPLLMIFKGKKIIINYLTIKKVYLLQDY